MDVFQDSFLGDIQLGSEDAPSRFLGPTSPWSFSLSPSFFGRNSPSMSGEMNPFEFSFDTDSPVKKASLDDWDVRTPGASDPTSAGEPRRKRAMSSPAVTPGGTGFDLTFGGMNSFKRPRLSLDAEDLSGSGSATSGSSKLRHGFENEGSPVSSSVFTPPDSAVSFFPYDKDAVSAFNDPNFFQHDDESLYQSVLAASTQSDFSVPTSISDAPSTMVPTPENIPVTTPSGHSTYAQFVFAPSASALDPSAAINGSGVHRSVDNVSPFILHLEQERNNLLASGMAYQQPNPGPLSLPPRRVNAPGQTPAFMPRGGLAKRTKGKPVPIAAKGKKALGKKGKKAVVEEPEEEVDEADEEARRKLFLERNRIAACKSRQKKKERVGNLESQASDIAGRNHALQATALALRDEVMQLRDLLSLHDGCTCEHIGGYLFREQSGGGIPTIDSLSGRTLGLDYTNVPTMGSVDDLYAELERDSREGSIASDASNTATALPAHVAPKDVTGVSEPPQDFSHAISMTLAPRFDDDIHAGIDIAVGPSIPLRPRAAVAA